MPDILAAVYDFVLAHVRPALPPEHIVRGWQNRAHLPVDSTEYAVLTLIGAVRRGTNVRIPAPGRGPSGALTVAKMALCDVQVDFCGRDAAARADCLELLARDARSVDFLRPYGVSSHYADDPRAMTFENESAQWEPRYMTVWHLACWSGTDLAADYFDAVTTRFENVDVHHPPAPPLNRAAACPEE